MKHPPGQSRPSAHIPDSVSYIDNRLPQLHAGFMHPTIKYDTTADQYVAPPTPADPAPPQAIPPRPLPEPAEAKKFWSKVFPQAMDRLSSTQSEPLGRYATGCSIRCETDWAGVRSRLDKAQGSYEIPPRSSKFGDTKAFLTKLYRKAADASDRMKLCTKVAVQIDYISPVVALVDILLDAAAVSSDVRNQVCSAFKPEDMEDDFETIEFSVGLYVGDLNIHNAAVDLVNSIFMAMEDAIGFFLSSRAFRARDALLKPGDYQKGLINKLDDVKKHSARLVRQVDLADKHSSRTGLEKLFAAADASSKQLDEIGMSQKLSANQTLARMLNGVDRLLRDGEERAKQRVREAEERAEKRAAKRYEEVKQQLDELKRIATPSPGHSPSASPYLSPQGFVPTSSPYLLPPTQMPQFSQLGAPWLTPPLAQQYYPQPSVPPVPTITSNFLLSLLTAPRFDQSDVRDILSQRSQMFPASVRRSETALLTYEFRRWLTHLSSQSLLIEGDRESEGGTLSAVSLISALVHVATKDRKGHIPLLWCCSLHSDEDDEDSDDEDGSKKGGPQAMVTALIAQMLQQHSFDLPSMLSDRHVPNLDLVRRADIKDLCRILEWLIRRLPTGITLLCLLDDVGYLEGDPSSQKALLRVLRTLFRLARDKQLACAIKLLMTSADYTDGVADLFEEQGGLVVDFGSLDEGDGLEEGDIGGFDGSDVEGDSDDD
ncbi:hypothetical protein BJX99DRAFT_259340 [Aspergillus californicus]